MQTKKYPFPRYISVFWEKSDFEFNQSNNLCTPSNNLAWLFKSGGDRVPIPLKIQRSSIKATTSDKMLKYREMFWLNYFVFSHQL